MSSGLFDDVLGNIDLTKRPVVKNADGTVSTVRSMSANFDGREVLIPTVSDDGRIMGDDEAIKAFQQTGRSLGSFPTVDAANAYAEQLHNDQAARYAPAPLAPTPGGGLFDDVLGARPAAPTPAAPQPGLLDRIGTSINQSLLDANQAMPWVPLPDSAIELRQRQQVEAAKGPQMRAAPEPSFLDEVVGKFRSGWNQGQQGLAMVLDPVNPVQTGDAVAQGLGYQSGEEANRGALAQQIAESGRRANMADRESSATSAAFKEIADADKTGKTADIIKAVASNPRAIASVVAQSLGNTAPQLALSAAVPASRAMAALTAGTGSFTAEQGMTVLDVMTKAGVDTSDPGQVSAFLADKKAMGQAREKALKRGLAVGTFDALTAGFAGSLLRNARRSVSSIGGRVLGEGAVQAGGGAAGEAAAQLASEGQITSQSDIVLEAAAETPTFLAEGRGQVAEALAAAKHREQAAARARPAPPAALPSTESPVSAANQANPSTQPANPSTPRAAAGDVVAAEDSTDLDRLLGTETPATAKPAAVAAAKTEVRQAVEQLPAEASTDERAAVAAAVAEKHGVTVADMLLAEGAPTASNEVEKMDIAAAPEPSAPARLSATDASSRIDQRLASLDEAAAAVIPQSRAADLARERDEIETMLREHDQAIADGVNLAPANRLTPDERTRADARRLEIRAELERGRAAAGAADQRDRLQARLSKIDRDADLIALAESFTPGSDNRSPTATSPAYDSQRRKMRQDEPPLANGMTRLYHGSAQHGRYDGPAWFSTDREYAANYRKGAELQFVDYPTSKVNEALDPDGYGQTVQQGHTWNAELDTDVTGPRRPLAGAVKPAQDTAHVDPPAQQPAARPAPVLGEAGVQDAGGMRGDGRRGLDGPPARDGAGPRGDGGRGAAAPTDAGPGRANEQPASGIPAGLPVRHTDATRSLSTAVNGHIRGAGATARDASFREVDKGHLPDPVARAITAFEQATGTEVAIVRNQNRDAIDFNGISTRSGVLYVDESAEHPVTTVAAHEFVHQLRADARDLYDLLETEIRRQGKLPAWLRELKRQGDAKAAENHVEELTANAVGDALADRAFLDRMARESPGPFKRVADAFLKFLDGMLDRARGLGSEKYLKDVAAFRDVLADVLAQYSPRVEAGLTRDGRSELMLSRRDEARDPVDTDDSGGDRAGSVREFPKTATAPFRRWFGESKVTDNDGAPLVVYHGTGEDFWTFEGKSGEATGHATAPFGHFFTSKRELAQGYAENASGGVPADERVVDAYLSIQRPYEMALDEAQAIDSPEEARSVREWLEGRGYDGIHIPEADNWIAFRSEQIKSASANRGSFDPANPDIRFLRRTRKEAEHDAEKRRKKIAGELPVSRGTPGWNYDTGVWEGRKGALKRLRASLQDKMTAWQDVQGQIERQLGQVIDDTQNVYRIENLMHGRVGEGIERIERGQVEPLVEAMRAAGVKPDQLDEYLYARHAKERNAEIAKINPKMPDGGSGMTNADADQILADADTAKLEPLAKRVDAIIQGTRKRLLEHGLITQEAFDAMGNQYAAYVPLRGKATTETDFQGGGGPAGRGVDGRAAPVKAALGRGAGNRAVHILGEVIGDAQRSVIAAEKARVGRAVMRLVLANPNPKLWQVEPVQTERKVDAGGEVYEAVVNDWSDPSVVAVRHRGKLYKVQINAQPLAQALNNVGVDNLGTVTRAAGALNRYFAAVLTKYNPAFLPVNASRDALFGLSGLATEHGEAAALDAALHYPQAARAAFRQARGSAGTGTWDNWAAEFAEHGGKTGYVAMPSAEDLARKIGSGKLTSYSPTGLARAARSIADTIGVLNDAVENSLRLSAYVTVRKRGLSADAAAEYAKNLTVNFNRKGFDGSALNSWFLFYNAALQGAHRTGTLLRRPKTYAYLGALAGAQIIATIAAMGMEDDNGDPLWDKVPDHVKRRNLVIVTPDSGVITIPMPYGFNLFPYLAGRITGAVLSKDEKPADKAAAMTASLLGAVTESFSPVPLGEGPVGLVPEALGIGLGVQTNRNDFGRPIRKENTFGPDVPLASVGRPDTLEVFKLVSTGLNRIGGGDDFTPPPMSAFDLAPEDIQYLLQKLTGGTGKFVVDMLTVAQKATGGESTPDLKPRDIPITSRFVTNIDEQASQASLFYDRRETIERSLKRVRSVFESDGAEAAEKLLKDTPELTGAKFKRRKQASKNGGAGQIVTSNGLPQFEVAREDSVFGAYKAAIKAGEARNDGIEQAYKRAPGSLIPTEATRARDADVRSINAKRQSAHHDFNGAWVRDVVGAAE